MDKAKLKEALQEIMQDQISKMVTGDDSDVAKMINAAVQSSVAELQETLIAEPRVGRASGQASESLVLGAIPNSRMMGGNMVVTPKGSILDLGRKHTPWVKLSEEMEQWATAFAEYLKSKGKVISKVLQESDDTAGGYELVLEGR